MSVTVVGICNDALIGIGSDRISSITEDTRRAQLLNTLFEPTRDEVLSKHPWNFAIKRVTLAANSTTPDSEYTYSYDIPNDSLRVLDMPESTGIDWVEEDGQILTNESSSIKIRYIYRNTDPTKWSPSFADALAWRLGGKIAYALTQSLALFDYCEKKFKTVVQEARTVDGQTGKIKAFIADDWTDRRR